MTDEQIDALEVAALDAAVHEFIAGYRFAPERTTAQSWRHVNGDATAVPHPYHSMANFTESLLRRLVQEGFRAEVAAEDVRRDRFFGTNHEVVVCKYRVRFVWQDDAGREGGCASAADGRFGVAVTRAALKAWFGRQRRS